jgi:hypothetical protein
LASNDRQLVEGVLDSSLRTNPAISIWDFADSLELEISKREKDPLLVGHLKVADRERAIDELLERFRKLNDAKESRIKSEQAETASKEVTECTFTPSLIKNPLYNDVKSRYKNSKMKEKIVDFSSPNNRVDDFHTSLRDTSPPSPNREIRTEFKLRVTEETMRRLDEASEFYEEYRDKMFQLREYHSNLINQERAGQAST